MIRSREGTQDFSLYATRRKELLEQTKEQHSERNGVVMLIADFENDRAQFWQESSFYYYSGITEPGAVLMVPSVLPSAAVASNSVTVARAVITSAAVVTPGTTVIVSFLTLFSSV